MGNNHYFFKEEDGKFFFLYENEDFIESTDGLIPHQEDKHLYMERTGYRAIEFAKAFKLKILKTHLYMNGELYCEIDVNEEHSVKEGYNLNKMKKVLDK